MTEPKESTARTLGRLVLLTVFCVVLCFLFYRLFLYPVTSHSQPLYPDPLEIIRRFRR
jgi:hypothetical protein